MIRTWLRSRLICETRACFFSVFFLISAFSGFSDNVPVGTIVAWAGTNSPPAGWLICDGGGYNIADYPELYQAIGHTYPGGSGVYFGVPNLKSRVIVGLATSGTFTSLGKTGGVETVTLTVNQMPIHRHSHAGLWPSGGAYDFIYNGGNWNWIDVYSTYVGGGQPHENMPPYLVVHYIIKALPDESFFGDLEEIELWNLKIGLWIFGGLCAVICSVCFFLRH